MMEDEECLLENSNLKVYLQNLGFSDVQVKKGAPTVKFEVPKPNNKNSSGEPIDEDVIDQINIIIATQMLFEEDISSVENLLSNFKVVKTGMVKCMFKGFFGVAVIFLGLFLYWIIGHYAFIFVSAFYAFNAADYLRRKHLNRSRLNKLAAILQGNFTLLKKTVKFIDENKSIESTNFNTSLEFIEGFDFYKNFKNDFLMSVLEIVNVLVESTKKLINNIPLYDNIENPEYYLCNNFNKNYDSVDLTKVYEIYLLVQSEFLQRLILSLIPNIQLKSKDNFSEINKILTETCLNLLKIKNKLSKKFKFLYLNGIHVPKANFELKCSVKNGITDNAYLKEFVLVIHETAKSFQNLLLQCRVIEDSIKSDKISDCVEEKLIKMQEELSACQRSVTDSLIFLKKSNAIKNKINQTEIENSSKEEEEIETKNVDEAINKIMVGYSDLDPKLEDEIFEMYLANEKGDGSFDAGDWDLDDRLQKRLEKEYCENVIKELKLKIVDKAKYWKKKEKELLKKKGLADECTENESSDSDQESDSEQETIQHKNILHKKDLEKLRNLNTENEKSITDKHETKVSSDINENNSRLLFGTEILKKDHSETQNSEPEITQSFLPAFNKNFLNDLNAARSKIFNSDFAAEEELFCASGEESSDEDISS